MNYINKTVSIYGTEIDFIKAFASELCAADSRIICETDIEAEFNQDTSYKPIIVFNINDCYKIKLRRSAVISTGISKYAVVYVINGVESATITEIPFITSALQYLKVDERCYKFSLVYNTNFLSISFARYNYILPSQADFNIFSYHTDDFNIVSAVSDTSTPSTQCKLIRIDETGNNDSYTFANRLNYACGEDIEIIENKVLIKSDNFERIITDIIDCSTVTKDSIIDIDGSKYYALDSHTLALIAEPSIIEIT